MRRCGEGSVNEAEDGRVSVLMLALGLLVFAVIAVGVNVTVVRLARNQIQGETDQLAAFITVHEAGEVYYSPGMARSNSGLLQVAEDAWPQVSGDDAGRLTQRRVRRVWWDGDVLFVSTSANVRIPLLHSLLGVSVPVHVESSVRRE